ncbi:hypothetical protein OsccyDRAFT_4425 [Leptolyngbyaceae cyanobacterium JSC-12]|nr:hypothetical protein OsccyDRAFT_4425 [Leptolyngbyaceae cyanobacterium JSC-12]
MNRIFALTSRLALIAFAMSVSSSISVHAQVADVPAVNAKGDYTTARLLGNRGYYRNTHWLVVDPSGSLNCRATPNGTVKTKLGTGWVVTASFPGKDADAVVMQQGSPWLRVIPQEPLGGLKNQTVCFVRANNRYVAPISIDFISNGGVRAVR